MKIHEVERHQIQRKLQRTLWQKWEESVIKNWQEKQERKIHVRKKCMQKGAPIWLELVLMPLTPCHPTHSFTTVFLFPLHSLSPAHPCDTKKLITLLGYR